MITLLFLLNLFNFSLTDDFNLPDGKWWMNEEVVRELNLTAQQQKELGNLYYAHLEKAIDLRAKVEKEELKLGEILSKDTINEKEAMEQVKKLLDARNQMHLARAELFLKVRMVLKPEQWIKLKNKFKEKIKGFREERRRMHRPEPPDKKPILPPEPLE